MANGPFDEQSDFSMRGMSEPISDVADLGTSAREQRRRPLNSAWRPMIARMAGSVCSISSGTVEPANNMLRQRSVMLGDDMLGVSTRRLHILALASLTGLTFGCTGSSIPATTSVAPDASLGQVPARGVTADARHRHDDIGSAGDE